MHFIIFFLFSHQTAFFIRLCKIYKIILVNIYNGSAFGFLLQTLLSFAIIFYSTKPK